jgi:hypothetical protein
MVAMKQSKNPCRICIVTYSYDAVVQICMTSLEHIAKLILWYGMSSNMLSSAPTSLHLCSVLAAALLLDRRTDLLQQAHSFCQYCL